MARFIRIIAKLDIKGPNLIKGIQFDGNRVLGTAEEFAEIYYREGVDELIYQDAVASVYRRNCLTEIVTKTAKRSFVPLTVAGGIRSVEDIRGLLRAGADKVAINTAAVENPDLIRDAARIFGSQCIVASLEVYRQEDNGQEDGQENNSCEVWIDYGRERTRTNAFKWAQRVVELGAGEILLTSINRDGTGRGFDVDLVKRIASAVSVPVIACGGAGKPEHVAEVIQKGSADAVAVASLLHYKYAKPVNSHTMNFSNADLRMGQSIDSGNIDFLNSGYGGLRVTPVSSPVTLRGLKQYLGEQGILTRLY